MMGCMKNGIRNMKYGEDQLTTVILSLTENSEKKKETII